ncbi:MAG: hypothetical protein HYU73_18950 [Betaproteobacteria bacterium]|nr:hypothetical protein [Betaproteobacteria bacterium]
MRALAVFALLASCGAAAQGSPDAFEITQRFAASGALQTALTRIAQLQPATAAAPRWGDWEQLRCELMYRLSRHQELAQRVAALPASVAEKTARTCLLQGARAAVAVAQGATARDFLARLIWRQEPAADELRQARLLVIESYLAEHKPQDAYALMLRYQQDFKPVDRDTAARFVEALLAAGMEKEAVNWLSQLDDASPLKLQLRLKTSLIAPEAAIAQARAALARTGNGAAWWVVLQHAATLQKDRTLLVEALENLLQLAGDKPPERLAALVAELWQSYAAAAQDAANQNQLLVGDDAKWADYASRRAAASPAVARAFFAYLAQQSKFSDTRRNAQLQLAFSLQQGKLGLTAIRLFGDAARFPVAQLDPQARYLLGSMALENNQPLTAARYWQGLATPPTLDPDEWRIRLAQALVRAGAADPGAAVLRALAAGSKALPAGIMQRAVASVQELQDAGHAKTADELYRALLPLADAPLRREILFGRGRIAEANNDFQRAADYLLEAALLIDSRATDALAVDARLAAAANLGRAGLKDDARAQLNWLRKNVKDPEKLELIRRELQKLGAASARRQPGGNHSAR